jgi:hypothetical protein
VATSTNDVFTGPTVSIPAGSYLEVLNYGYSAGSGHAQRVFYDYGDGRTMSRTLTETLVGAKIHGPLSFGPQCRSNGAWFALDYRLVSASSAEASAPSTAVVIPADQAGPVQIILESSTDLITWTAALPGSYGTSTEKRFFRVRAVR